MVHLHVHSMYSLRDSIIRPEEMIERLKEIGQDTIAITDHGRCLGSIAIYKQLLENDMKYIHGCEMYICNDVKIKDKTDKYFHLLILCKNEKGRQNLNKLMSISEHPDNKYNKPRIDFEILSQYSEGLICLSACMVGEISRFLMSGNFEEAYSRAKKYKELFGEDYYLEIQSRQEKEQMILNKQIVELAKKLDIEVVTTTDAHYVKKEDAKYQSKYAFNGSFKEDGEMYFDCYLQSEDEVRENLFYLTKDMVDTAIKNTHTIADKCNLEMPLSAPIMPHIDIPRDFKDGKDWLTFLCEGGFAKKLNIDYKNKTTLDKNRYLKRYVCINEGSEELEYKEELYQMLDLEILEYIERFEYELESLDKMGFIDYILLVNSYANIVTRRGIARGSGGGSLICYLTHITDIDPIEHKLYFERFIDVGAIALLEAGEITKKQLKIPDIDLDFGKEACGEILQFLYNKYGEEKVASIGKFGNNKTKGSIRDMCKVLNIELQEADIIAKSFSEYEIEEIDMMISGDIPTPKSAEEAIRNTNKYKELFDYVRKLNGLPKSFGLHSCGKIISTSELDYFLPSCYDKTGIRFLQGDMHDVEDVGLVKVDVLGLRTVDQEYDTLELSNESIEFIDSKQDFSDAKVLDIFKKGNTLGIFQMASFGMRETLKKMKVSGIEDISVANALYRPGAMAYIDNFCRRKDGVEEFEYLHEDLEPILKNTYGIMVFQEQIIEIGRLAKLSNPDELRQATAKKKLKVLAKVKPELEENLKKRGWSQEQFNTLWADMLEFAKYSFNKSHSSAYAIIAYMTAKQKAYYPIEFYCGLMNSYIGHSAFVKDEVGAIVEDMGKNKVQFNKLNFRQDHRRCGVQNGKINHAVPLIRDLNVETGRILYDMRDMKFESFVDLILHTKSVKLDTSKLEVLIKLDFFSEFGNVTELCRILEITERFKFGEAKSVRKVKLLNDPLYEIVAKYSTDKNAKGKELATFTIVDCKGLLRECEEIIKLIALDDIPVRTKIEIQQEYLGYISLVSGKEDDRPKLYVKENYIINKRLTGKPCGCNIICQSIGSGKQSKFVVWNKTLNKCGQIKKGDVINCLRYKKNGDDFELLEFSQII